MQLSNPHGASSFFFFFLPVSIMQCLDFLGIVTGEKNGAKCLLFLSKHIQLGSQLASDKLPACVVVTVRHFCSIRAQWKKSD